MNDSRFAFLHVGPDTTLPSLLVRSIRRFHPAAAVHQFTDLDSSAVPGTTEVVRFEGDASNLMTFRLEAFAHAELGNPTLFLDTDMLFTDRVEVEQLLGDHDVAACKREYSLRISPSLRRRGMLFSYHPGATLGEVYPYVACTTITRTTEFWRDCLDRLRGMDPKFHFWYGDQEAIRDAIRSHKYRVKLLPESVYGCLPDETGVAQSAAPRIYHFKGMRRKQLMIAYATRMGLF